MKKLFFLMLTLCCTRAVLAEPDGTIHKFKSAKGIGHNYVQKINGKWVQVERHNGQWKPVEKNYLIQSETPFDEAHHHDYLQGKAAYDNYVKNGGKESYMQWKATLNNE